MAKEFAPGSGTGLHSHSRGQLIFAVRGLMEACTADGTWIVTPGHAIWIPAGTVHDIRMHGHVSMRTAYVEGRAVDNLPENCIVVGVSSLLAACLVSLAQEPPAYNEAARGGYLAGLILDELVRAPAAQFALPLPLDKRLAKLAARLIANPASDLDIDGWSAQLGMSRRTLTRLFRSQTGMSFGTWRRRLRLIAALKELANGNSLPQVVARVGYKNTASFRSMIRREFDQDFEEFALGAQGYCM